MRGCLGFGALAMIRYYLSKMGHLDPKQNTISCPDFKFLAGGFMTTLMPEDNFLEVPGIGKLSILAICLQKMIVYRSLVPPKSPPLA